MLTVFLIFFIPCDLYAQEGLLSERVWFLLINRKEKTNPTVLLKYVREMYHYY